MRPLSLRDFDLDFAGLSPGQERGCAGWKGHIAKGSGQKLQTRVCLCVAIKKRILDPIPPDSHNLSCFQFRGCRKSGGVLSPGPTLNAIRCKNAVFFFKYFCKEIDTGSRRCVFCICIRWIERTIARSFKIKSAEYANIGTLIYRIIDSLRNTITACWIISDFIERDSASSIYFSPRYRIFARTSRRIRERNVTWIPVALIN